MKSLKTLLQEVTAGIKAWANANFSLGTHVHGNISNNGKVGTTANLPLITGTGGAIQAGAFGNAANTFCEGNDSRLSDARTPVAHTHTKSDVTDLLNSNFIPSANNSYDLGSSSYQWNNLYAKGYYYNGTPWGLDKANTWTGTQRFTSAFTRQEGTASAHGYVIKAGFVRGSAPSTNTNLTFRWVDSNDNVLGFLDFVATSSTYAARLNLRTENNGTQISESIQLETDLTGSYFSFKPLSNGNVDLGTSTNKWATLNGINPGALSLPDYSAEFDVSGQIVPPTGENRISINWGRNTFTPSVNGWLSVRIHKATSIEIYRSIRSSYCVASRVESADDICACSPVVAGVEYTIKIQATQVSPDYDHFRLSPCLGNV